MTPYVPHQWGPEDDIEFQIRQARRMQDKERVYENTSDQKRVAKKYLVAIQDLKKGLQAGTKWLTKLQEAGAWRDGKKKNEEIKASLINFIKPFIKRLEESKNYYTAFSPEARHFITHRHNELAEAFDELEQCVSERKIFKFVRRKNLYVKRKCRQLEDAFTKGRMSAKDWKRYEKEWEGRLNHYRATGELPEAFKERLRLMEEKPDGW